MAAYPTNGVYNISPPTPFPATIAASGNWQSGVIINQHFPAIAACVTSTQIGNLTIQRYADLAGTIPVGATTTQELTASTAAYAAVNDGVPYLSFVVEVTNTGGSTADITGTAILTGWWA